MATQAVKTALDYLRLDKQHPVDEQTIPEWGKGPDGKFVSIVRDDRLPALFADWQADACGHGRHGIIHWINAGNAHCYNWYCPDCGTQLSQNVSRELALKQGVVEQDDANRDSLASRFNAYRDERAKRLEQIKDAAAERMQPVNRAEYSDELQTIRWRALRDRVLQRAGFQCEGCLNAHAEHVHHLTYAHRGNEFAFELRALCADCHARWHECEAAE